MSTATDSARQTAARDSGVLVPVEVHFDDLDSFGMLHNARYGVLTERAWISYWQGRGIAFDADWGQMEDGFNVVKEVRITFDLPITRPGRYAVRLRVEHLGTTSLTYGFDVRDPEAGVTFARGTRTVVRLDPETRRPAPWSARARALAEDLRPAVA
ncbi:thioesterase family protein [Streptomyces sp. NPDC047002]|uniref:acyl-CoA thioesterase n=1 Tax=Streptomyces sp. NPDC047002 TaxID=3155475 RepID=UPI0034572D47